MKFTDAKITMLKHTYPKLSYWIVFVILLLLISKTVLGAFANSKKTELQNTLSFKQFLLDTASENKNPGIKREILVKHINLTGKLSDHAELGKIPIGVLAQTKNIFKGVVDISSNLSGGIQFFIVYEASSNIDNSDSSGKILAAEAIENGQTHRAVLYAENSHSDMYLTPQGDYVFPKFLKSPLKTFKRISSNFSKSRNHPVLFKKRHHKGMDFAAKTGTEVMAVADGKILIKGHAGSFGNLICLSHDANKETRYGHLLKFSPNIKIGDTVKKGQVIGYVGMTGLATGPHLHFEFLQNGKQIDPRRMLSASYKFDIVEKQKFDEVASKYFEVIDKFKSYQNI